MKRKPSPKASPVPVVPPGHVAIDVRDHAAVLHYLNRKIREARVNIVIAAATPDAAKVVIERGDKADKLLRDGLFVAESAIEVLRQAKAAGGG